MKKILVSLILILTFLLQGCGGNPEYYDTCEEAFLAVYGNTFDKYSELCTIEFSDELTLYAAFTPNMLPYKFVSCQMKEKDGKYRVLDSSPFPPTNGITDDGWYHASPDNGEHLLYQWIDTSCLPEERDSLYQYRDFSFEDINGDTVGITLVFYGIELDY